MVRRYGEGSLILLRNGHTPTDSSKKVRVDVSPSHANVVRSGSRESSEQMDRTLSVDA